MIQKAQIILDNKVQSSNDHIGRCSSAVDGKEITFGEVISLIWEERERGLATWKPVKQILRRKMAGETLLVMEMAKGL